MSRGRGQERGDEMGWKDLVRSVRDKVLGERATPEPAEELTNYQILLRDYDLHSVFLHDEIPRLYGERDAMRRAWQERDFAAYRSAFEAARAEGDLTENGKPRYLLVKDWFLEEFMAIPDSDDAGPRHEVLLNSFADYFRRDPSPFSAATYADALRVTAYAWRGTACAADVNMDQADQSRRFLRQADAVLDSQPDPQDFSWRASDFRRSAETGSFSEYQRRFEAAWALDRYNIDLCRSFARMIMPRWLGRDEHDLEVFARRAAELTKDRFGYGFYALIQAANTEVGEHEIEDTLCDPVLVKQGFEDLLARFPAPSNFNLYADMLEWMKDNEALADLLETRFRTIVPEIWYGDTIDDKFVYAFETLLEADEVLKARRRPA